MAKVIVKEAVQSATRGSPLTRDHYPLVVKILLDKIESPEDKAQFKRDMGVY